MVWFFMFLWFFYVLYPYIYKLLVIYSYPLKLTSTIYCKYGYMCS